MSKKKATITVCNLEKKFGDVEVLKNINVKIKAGEVVCVVGPSGSGKSTFLRCLNYLEKPTNGNIVIGEWWLRGTEEKSGNVVVGNEQTAKEIRKTVGMVFQSFNLWPHKTVLENVIEAPLMVKKAKKVKLKRLPAHYWKKWGCWIEKITTLINCRVDSNNVLRLPEH